MYRQSIEQLETRRLLDGEGLSAIYFNNANFTGTNVSRVETAVNVAWNNTTPGAGIGNAFSSRFAGRVTAVESGNYTFSVQVGGSVRLWVDDVLRIDQFTNQTATHTSAAVSLVAGRSYHMVLEYRATGSATGSSVGLMWTRPGQSAPQVIPQSQLSADNRALPTGAFGSGAVGFFNVKTIFGAVGDGIADDTDAIQLAIEFAKGSSWGGSVYFPAGTYRVTNSLDYVQTANLALRGQNRDNVVIKLDNAAAGFNNIASPKALLTMFSIPGGNTGNQFGNSLFDLTFDTGANNPGAIGVNWLNNNQGSMRDVTVRTSDATRRGITGVDLSSPWPGPALFTNVLVEGFDYAFRNLGQFNYSQTFDRVNIQNQLVNGIYNDNGSMFFRNLRSINSVPAIRNVADSGNFVLVDSVLTGGSASVPAIINYGSATLRNVSTEGYSTPLGFFWSLPGNYVSEFVTGAEFVGNGPFGGFNVRNGGVGFAPTSLVSLNLPLEEAPTPPTEDLALWVRVNPAATDDTANIQAAFNTAAAQGRSTVYFPKSTYNITGPITIGGSVRRVVGLGSAINSTGSFFDNGGVVFTFASTLTGPITFENFVSTYESSGNGKFLEDRSPNTVVLRNLIVVGNPVYNNVGTGVVAGKKLFIEDVTMAGFIFNNLKVWGRQVNSEGRTTSIINNGSDLLILGLKTEGIRTIIDNRGGGRTELLGAYIYPVPLAGDPPLDPNTPAFINTDSTLAITVAGSWNNNWVREVRSGVTQTLGTSQTIGPAGFRKLPLYSSYVIPGSVAAASNLSALATSPASITLRWTDNATNESGFVVQRRNGSAPFSTIATLAAQTTAFSDFNLFAGTTYSYRILAAGGPTPDTFSNTAVAATLPGPPAAPTNITLTTSSTSITLAWTDVAENETSYLLERSLDGVAFLPLATLPAGAIQYTDATLSPATPYYYRLRASNTLGASPNTPVASTLTRPATPVLPATSDSGFDPADRITRQTRPQFTGTGKPGVTAKLFINGVLSRSVIIPASGTFGLSPPSPLAFGLHTATVVASLAPLADSAASDAISFTIDTVAPTAGASSFAPGPQIVSLPFSEDVGPSVANVDFTLLNLTTGRGYKGSRLAVTFDTPTRTARVSLPPGSPARLPNGNYRLTAPNSAIEDRAGNYLANNLQADFYILEGDVNRDRSVTSADQQILTSNLGASNASYSQGDLNGDGNIDQTDLNLLLANLGNTLPPAPPPNNFNGIRPLRSPLLPPPEESPAMRAAPSRGLPPAPPPPAAFGRAGQGDPSSATASLPGGDPDTPLSFLPL